MSRPSGKTDDKLIQAAQELLDEKGFTGLKLRDVASRAGVNLGMHHYYFKSKANFEKRVLAAMYERFFSKFSLETGGKGTPLERLRRALVTASRFVRDNRRQLVGFISDVVNGNKTVLMFAALNFPRHVVIVVGLIRECQKKGYIEKMPLHLVISLLFPSIMAPNMAMAMVEHKKVPGIVKMILKNLKADILADATLEKRVDYVLRAVGANPHPRRAS